MSNKRLLLNNRFFFHYGRFVASRPWLAIVCCIVLTGLFSVGMRNLRRETNMVKCWVAEESSTRQNTDWLWNNYPPDIRFSSAVFEADNVLTPDVLRTMYAQRKAIELVRTESGVTWRDVCVKVPVVKPPNLGDIIGKRKKRQLDFEDDFFGEDFEEEVEADDQGFFDTIREIDTAEEKDKTSYAEFLSASEEYFPNPYCEMVESMETACMENSILELWANDGK